MTVGGTAVKPFSRRCPVSLRGFGLEFFRGKEREPTEVVGRLQDLHSSFGVEYGRFVGERWKSRCFFCLWGGFLVWVVDMFCVLNVVDVDFEIAQPRISYCHSSKGKLQNMVPSLLMYDGAAALRRVFHALKALNR